jgi:hypothetical protein
MLEESTSSSSIYKDYLDSSKGENTFFNLKFLKRKVINDWRLRPSPKILSDQYHFNVKVVLYRGCASIPIFFVILLTS